MAAVPRELLPALEEEGLEAAAPGRLGDRLDRVDGILAHLPDLSAIVSDVVAALHPLAAEPGYDISHSQPRWRSRIFVSFPERDDEVGALRLAESVVHEAMHLHLTNEEARTPLVAKSLEHSYSPWRGTARAVGGVGHAPAQEAVGRAGGGRRDRLRGGDVGQPPRCPEVIHEKWPVVSGQRRQ